MNEDCRGSINDKKAMAQKNIITRNPQETFNWGREWARSIKSGRVIVLKGELGSGKTCLVQGICKGLHVKELVHSPTFTILNVYQGNFPVYHMDFYRIKNTAELKNTGCTEYFYQDGVCLVEWGDRFPEILPATFTKAFIRILDENKRKMTIENVTRRVHESVAG